MEGRVSDRKQPSRTESRAMSQAAPEIRLQPSNDTHLRAAGSLQADDNPTQLVAHTNLRVVEDRDFNGYEPI